MDTKKVLLALSAAVVLPIGGVAYAANGSSGANGDDGEDTYEGSVLAPDRGGSELQELASIDEAAAERAALEAVPGTVHETDLETSDNGYVVYDIEVAGDDGRNHEVKVDAGDGEILHQALEDDSDESDAGEIDDSSN